MASTWGGRLSGWLGGGNDARMTSDTGYELLEHAENESAAEPEAIDARRQLPGPRPTTSQAQILRRIPGRVPLTSYAIALVEFAERASYYGVGGCFTNFVQRPLPPGGPGTGAPPPGTQLTPGALGLGLQVSTTVTTVFTLLSYFMPLVGGALSDMRWGKFRTVAFGTAVGAVAHALVVYAALPSLLADGSALLPFVLGVILLATSAGLIKSTIAPLMAEQYAPQDDYVSTLPSGEKVIIDREATIQRIMSAYYSSINVGAFTAVASSFAEKYVGFWLAFLIPGLIFLLMPLLLYLIHPHLLSSVQPTTSALLEILRFARRSFSSSSETISPKISQDDLDFDNEAIAAEVDGAKEADFMKALSACKIFLFFTIYNLGIMGLNPVIISMAGSMTTDGVPNDFLNTANPLLIVIAIPLLNKYLYPYLSIRKIPFGPVKRVVTGYLVAVSAMIWCAVLQSRVYRTSPCGVYATTCDTGTGVSPISAWWIFPAFAMTGLSESMAVVSGIEIAYIMSPPSLRSVAHALFLSMQAISSALVLAFLPIMHDPLLVWPFSIVAVLTALAALGIWRNFSYLDKEHFP